tara:strand:- start:277 stop:792 length:516 start_codon:yes stop_codon:yes gene_type:complete
MFFSDNLKFSIKTKKFTFKCFSPQKVTKNYVDALNNNHFVRYNFKTNISLFDQKKYIEKTNKSKDKVIFGVFNGKYLIGTVGSQKKTQKKYYIGIFIFNKKYRGKGLSKVMIKKAAKILKRNCNISYLLASVNEKNSISHKMFLSLGFKENFIEPKKLKKDKIYSVKVSKI